MTKLTKTIPLLFCALIAHAEGPPSAAVPPGEPVIDTARPLTPAKSMTIYLSPSLTTTLLFPAPVASISGYGLCTPGQTAGGLVELNYPAGSPLIELRALTEFEHVMMTVMCDHKLYCFDLRTGPRPDAAITFVRSGGDTGAPGSAVTAQQVADSRPVSSDAMLTSYLSLAKESDAIRDSQPSLYQDYANRAANYISDNGKVKTTVTRVHRWSKPDVTVLEGTAQNLTDHETKFDGRVTSVAIANELHPAKLTEGLHRAIPAGATVPLYVVLQGDYDGGRLAASIDNEFRIILGDPVGSKGTVWGMKNGRPPTGKVDEIPPVRRTQAVIPAAQTKLVKEQQQ
jgi:hypothetical protein